MARRMRNMPDLKQFWENIGRPGTFACAIFCSVLGIAVALSLLILGLWKTLLIGLCFGVGWFLGAIKDKPAFLRRVIDRLFHRERH
ncbi:MAG: DUF2273 domain-containing protein [Clostridia bacterium]